MIIKNLLFNLEKESSFSKIKNKSDVEEIERTKEVINIFDNKNGEELTKLYRKSDVILLADVIEKFVKVSTEEYGINPLYCVSLPGYIYQCALKDTDIKLQTLQDKDMILKKKRHTWWHKQRYEKSLC